ncbi:MAG: hypothetical protein AAGD47_06710 [Pseudomonadota bacterium]
MTRVAALLPALACAACLGIAEVADQSTVDPSYVSGGGFWNEGSTISVVAKAEPRGDRLAICGAWAINTSSALTVGYNHDVIGAAVIQLDGSNIINNLRFMNLVPYSQNIAGQTSNCTITDIAWEPDMNDRIEIRIPRQGFERQDPTGQPLLVFRQGPLPVLFP